MITNRPSTASSDRTTPNSWGQENRDHQLKDVRGTQVTWRGSELVGASNGTGGGSLPEPPPPRPVTDSATARLSGAWRGRGQGALCRKTRTRSVPVGIRRSPLRFRTARTTPDDSTWHQAGEVVTEPDRESRERTRRPTAIELRWWPRHRRGFERAPLTSCRGTESIPTSARRDRTELGPNWRDASRAPQVRSVARPPARWR
jgi:hypothetical protein